MYPDAHVLDEADNFICSDKIAGSFWKFHICRVAVLTSILLAFLRIASPISEGCGYVFLNQFPNIFPKNHAAKTLSITIGENDVVTLNSIPISSSKI
jgi:hypothetical protein